MGCYSAVIDLYFLFNKLKSIIRIAKKEKNKIRKQINKHIKTTLK